MTGCPLRVPDEPQSPPLPVRILTLAVIAVGAVVGMASLALDARVRILAERSSIPASWVPRLRAAGVLALAVAGGLAWAWGVN